MTMLYEELRPSNLDDYVWSTNNTKKIIMQWMKDPLHNPNLLLYGTTGTGKTTLAKIIQDSLSKQSEPMYVLASVDSGVNMIREKLIPFCSTGGFSDYKIIVLDECDNLSKEAFKMMRNVMDKYHADCRFIMTANHIAQIPDAIKGRTLPVLIEKLDFETYQDHVYGICDTIDIDISDNKLNSIIDRFYPNMRATINELQAYDLGQTDRNCSDIKSLLEQLLLIDNLSFNDLLLLENSNIADCYIGLYEIMIQKGNEQGMDVITDHSAMSGNGLAPKVVLMNCLRTIKKLIN